MSKQSAAIIVSNAERGFLLTRSETGEHDILHTEIDIDETRDQAARRILEKRAGLYIGVVRFVGSITLREAHKNNGILEQETVEYHIFTADEGDANPHKQIPDEDIVYLPEIPRDVSVLLEHYKEQFARLDSQRH
ncbi:MAG: NUDIX hydrolase [Candidatus Saccharimonadales bacterium]